MQVGVEQPDTLFTDRSHPEYAELLPQREPDSSIAASALSHDQKPPNQARSLLSNLCGPQLSARMCWRGSGPVSVSVQDPARINHTERGFAGTGSRTLRPALSDLRKSVQSSTDRIRNSNPILHRAPSNSLSYNIDDTAINYFMHVWHRAPWVNYLYDAGYGPFVLTVDSKFMIIRDIMMIGSVLWTLLVEPFEAAVGAFGSFTVVGSFCSDLFFALDIPLHFFLAIDKHQANVVHHVFDRRVIALGYMRRWFLVDVISGIPWGLSMQYMMHHTVPNIYTFKIIAFSQLIRVSKLVRAKIAMRFDLPFSRLALLRCSILAFVSAHWFACIWTALVSLQPESKTWVHALLQSKVGIDGPYDEFAQNLFGVYLWAIYFAATLVTTVGFGDITPQSNLECAVTSFGIVMGSIIWAFILSSLIDILNNMDKPRQNFEQVMDELNRIAERHKLPDALRHDARTYFFESEELWRFRAIHKVTEHMSPSLQGRTALALNKVWLERVPCFQLMFKAADHTPDALTCFVEVSQSLEQQIYPAGEVLSELALHIVHHGCLSAGGRILVTGDIWGEDRLCVNIDNHSRIHPVSVTTSSTFAIEIEKLHSILEKYPKARQIVRQRTLWLACKRGLARVVRKRTLVKEEDGQGGLARVVSDWQSENLAKQEGTGNNLQRPILHSIPSMASGPDDGNLPITENGIGKRLEVIESLLQRMVPQSTNSEDTQNNTSISIPPGWAYKIDPTTGCSYFVHLSSGRSQWQYPGWRGYSSPTTTPRQQLPNSSSPTAAPQWQFPGPFPQFPQQLLNNSSTTAGPPQ